MGTLLSNRLFYACLVLITVLQAVKCSAQNSWTQIPFGTNRNLNEIEYFDYKGTAIAADSGLVIWKKTGTQNWLKLQLPSVSPIVSLDRLTYDGSNHSYNYFISSNKKAYKLDALGTDLVEDTLPGWPNLTEKANRIVNLHISTISETRYGLACDSGRVLAYKSGLSGGQYRYQLSTLKPIRDIYPFNAWYVLAVSDSGKIWRTSTLTSPFAVMTQNHTTQKLNRIFGKNDNQIWIAGDNGTLLMSPDNGLNWTLIPIPTTLNINAGLVKGSVVWICGDNGLILYSKDNGANWFTEASNTTSNLKDIKSIGNNLYTVGENGTLMTINLILGNEDLEKNQTIHLIQENNQLILTCDPNRIRNVLVYNLQGREIPVVLRNVDSGLALQINQSGFFVVQIETVDGATQFSKVLLSR